MPKHSITVTVRGRAASAAFFAREALAQLRQLVGSSDGELAIDAVTRARLSMPLVSAEGMRYLVTWTTAPAGPKGVERDSYERHADKAAAEARYAALLKQPDVRSVDLGVIVATTD